MNALRVALAGCTGRMGHALVPMIAADPALELVAAVTHPDDPRMGEDAGQALGCRSVGVPVTTDVAQPCDVVIEFTLPDGCAQWAQWCQTQGVALVSGTTGLTAAQLTVLEDAATHVPIVWAPNMSVGVNLLLALARDLAAKLDEAWDIEICETHHRRKVDAPSGTADALLSAVSEGRRKTPGDVAVYGRAGQTGARPTGQIGVHAMRMGSVVGEHEVHFTSDEESLTVRHRAFSRDTFARGAIRAARWVVGRSPQLYAMQDVLLR